MQLGVTYHISVYATKPGYNNSETVTATLCWIDVAPRTEGIANGVANVRAKAVMIQTDNGRIKVTGIDDGTKVNVYGVNGVQVGSSVSHDGLASIKPNLQLGSIAIVRIGEKSIKVVVK